MDRQYLLDIKLLDIEPMIWRRVVVPAAMGFEVRRNENVR
jgi:hypothetical protein